MKTEFKMGNLIRIKSKPWEKTEINDIGIILESYSSGLWKAYLKILINNNVQNLLVTDQSKFSVEIIDSHE